MAAVDISNWDEKNTATTQTLSDSTSVSNLQKVQVIKVSEGTGSGTGDVQFSSSTWSNITDASDIVVTESDESTTRAYEIEELDTTNNVAWVWVYGSWNSGSTEMVVAAGSGDGTDYSVGGSGANPWSQTGVNAELVNLFDQSFSGGDNILDSSPNGLTGSSSGSTSTSDSPASQGLGANFDGIDDQIVINDPSQLYGMSEITIVGNFDGNRTSSSFQILLSMAGPNGSNAYFIDDRSESDFKVQIETDGGTSKIESLTPSRNTDHLLFASYNSGTLKGALDDNSLATDTSGSGNVSDASGNDFSYANNNGLSQYWDGQIDSFRIYSEEKSNDFRIAEYDASPKGGQTFFSWSGPEATVTDQTVTVPETQTTLLNPDPQINATVDISVPTSTATTVNPAPTVSPGAASLNLTASTASTANPEFTVQPGNTTVQTPVSTATVSNPDPAINAFNEVTVPETTAATVNPAPSLTVGQTILTPETTVTSSNPDLNVQPGETSLNISTTQVSASNPVIGLNRQIVVGVATNLESENPEPDLQAGAVSVQVPETTILTENPALQLKPGATSLQTEQATSLQTVNPDFNTVSGAAQLQVSETQLTASIQEPSIGLTLQFVSPTNALITNDERFFDMPDHTFTEGDLGDTLTATLKDDASPDGVDLTGATEIRLVVKDRDGVKVFDKEMSIVDSANGKIEYKWSENDFIEEPGVYRSKIKVFDSSGEPESFPNDGFRTIEVEEEIK